MSTLVTTYLNTDVGDFVFDACFSTDQEPNLKINREVNEVIFDIGMSDVMKITFHGQCGNNASSSVGVYTVLVVLQIHRLPIQITTIFATYENTLIVKLSKIDDNITGNGLRVTVTLQEIIVVGASTVKSSASSNP